MKKIQEIAVGAMSGGNSDNGANAGPFYLNSNVNVGSANVNIGASVVILSMLLFSFPQGKTFQNPGKGVLVI